MTKFKSSFFRVNLAEIIKKALFYYALPIVAAHFLLDYLFLKPDNTSFTQFTINYIVSYKLLFSFTLNFMVGIMITHLILRIKYMNNKKKTNHEAVESTKETLNR